MIRIIHIYVFLLISLCAYSNNQEKESFNHVKKSLSEVEGANMSLYDLYVDYSKTESGREKSLEYVELFLVKLDSTSTNIYVAELIDELSEYYEMGKFLFSKAILWRERELNIYDKLEDKGRKAELEYRLAKLYYKKSRYDKALYFCLKSIKYLETTNDSNYELKIDCYNLLGIIYFKCKDYYTSNDYFSKSAEKAREANDSTALLLAINNQSIYTNRNKDIKSTQLLIKEALKLAELVGDESLIFKMKINLIISHINVAEYSEASEILEDLKLRLTNIYEYGVYYNVLGFYYKSVGELNKAVDVLEKSVKYLSQGELEEYLEISYLMLESIYSQKGDVYNAHRIIKEYYNLEKTVSKDDMFLQLFKYQNEIILQSEREELINSRNYQRLCLVITIALLLIIVLIIYFILRKRALDIYNKEIELENKKLIQENAEQEINSKRDILEIQQMQQYQLDSLIKGVISKLNKINMHIKESTIRNEIHEVCLDLKGAKEDDQWKEMSQYIPEFNSEFFVKLLKDYPNLTINERRLCALLNLNMSTKEISDITKQSMHSINVARTRLRSKLGLTGEELSFQEFLSKYN